MGYYLQRLGNFQLAIEYYKRALGINENYADAYYNLGLIYLELDDFDQALKNAHAAYARGFPLDGLRKRLIKAGYWKEPKEQD